MTSHPPAPELVLITPVKDEIETIQRMVESVLQQTVPPQEWVIIDDGSTDGTRELLQSLAASASSIKLLALPPSQGRSLGGRVVSLIERGLENLTADDWTHWAKVDADLVLAPHYFERILGRFETEPELGIASGKPLLPAGAGSWRAHWTPDSYPLGMARIYRRACWNDIGGLMRGRQFDIVDVYTARFKGWQTASLGETSVRLLRRVDARMPHPLRRRKETGADLYAIGYHPAYFLMRAARIALEERPFLLTGLAMLWGYLGAAIRGERKVAADLFRFVRGEQRRMVTSRQLLHYLKEKIRAREPNGFV